MAMTDEEKAALLDAAADEHGYAHIEGIGERDTSKFYGGIPRYAFVPHLYPGWPYSLFYLYNGRIVNESELRRALEIREGEWIPIKNW